MSGVLSVCYLHPRRIAGSAMFLRALSDALRRTGHKSVVCFLSPPTAEVRSFLEPAGPQIESDPALFEGPVFAKKRAMDALIHKHRPSITHFHFMGLITGHPWAAKWAGVESVFLTDHRSLEEDEPDQPWSWWKRRVAGVIQSPVRRVITVSDFQREAHLKRRSLPPNLVGTIYNGVDLNRADEFSGNGEQFRRRWSIPSGHILITQISWLIDAKGLGDFIEAAALLARRFKKLHFCIAGVGPSEQAYRSMASAADLCSAITFTGDLSDPFASGVFAASDIFCQPSRWQEAFGWVIAEAMAFRKPVVATRTGGIPEVIQDGVTGWLTQPRNPSELADRIGLLIADPAMRQSMGNRGRASVGEKFSLDANITQYLQLYGLRGA